MKSYALFQQYIWLVKRWYVLVKFPEPTGKFFTLALDQKNNRNR